MAPQSNSEDLAFARRIQQRDEEAARELMQRWSGEMYGYAFRVLQDRSAAEDAFQEAMLGALQSIDRYDGRVPLRAWVYGILRHKVTDSLRKRGKEIVLSNEDPDRGSYLEDGPLAGHWKDSAQLEPWDENAEVLEVVQQCMETLPHNQREALELRAVRGLSSEDAASALELTNTNLRQILHRARQNIRRCVAGKLGEQTL